MAFVVRLILGEWKQDENGFFEHVGELEGFSVGVRLREQDGYASLVNVVKEKSRAGREDKVELSYQWPHWMMGPDWKQANPIYITIDEDMTLFRAIRADSKEVHLKVKIIWDETEHNFNSYRSNMDLGALTSKKLSTSCAFPSLNGTDSRVSTSTSSSSPSDS